MNKKTKLALGGGIILIAAVAAVTAAVAGGYYLYQTHGAYQRAQDDMDIDRSKILEQTFGEPMHTGTFTLSEATVWLKSHIQDGCQGVILRADCASLKTYAPKLDLGRGLENYLVMAVVDKAANAMREHVLVKFETLDENLEEALGSEGTLVIER